MLQAGANPVVALALQRKSALATANPKTPMTTFTTEKIEEATRLCRACAAASDRCAYGLLDNAASDEIVNCIRKCLDCATICRATATVLARGSGIASDMCRVCLEACLRCETECERIDNELTRDCAKACVGCEDGLRGVA